MGVFSFIKRKFFYPIWNCFHRVSHIIYIKVCCGGKNENLDIMQGINAVDTEAVLRIVDKDPEAEAERV